MSERAEPPSIADWNDTWSAELRRRVREIRAGRAELIDGEEVLAELRAIADDQ